MTTSSSPASFIEQVKSITNPVEQVRVQKFDSSGTKMLPYSRRDYYKIWVTVNPGVIHYATRTIALTEPALIFSNPRVPYAFESESTHGGYMCIFTESFLKANGRSEPLQESRLFRIGSNPVFFLDAKRLSLITSFYDTMVEEYNGSYTHRFDVIRHYLNLVIHEAMKMEPAADAIKFHNASERIASLFLELLDRQFPIASQGDVLRLRKAGDYAESLSVHVNHLNHAVREITNKSTSAHITERIVTEAKALLLHTDMTIAEIAWCLGFDYPNYFNTFFKKNTGFTPLSLRK